MQLVLRIRVDFRKKIWTTMLIECISIKDHGSWLSEIDNMIMIFTLKAKLEWAHDSWGSRPNRKGQFSWMEKTPCPVRIFPSIKWNILVRFSTVIFINMHWLKWMGVIEIFIIPVFSSAVNKRISSTSWMKLSFNMHDMLS